MPGGLMALIAYGVQDRFVLGDTTYIDHIIANYRINNINSESEWITLYKIINMDKNDECPVSYNAFTDGCSYCVCAVCKYNIDADSLKHYFNLGNKSCPMCRGQWTEFIIYINKTDIKNELNI